MRSKLLAAAACGTCLAALVCGQSALAQAESPDQVPRFEPAACPAMSVKALANARCGDLVVPEDRRRLGGRTIRLSINPNITLPGFTVGKPEVRVVSKPYPTNFGDLSEPEATDYSRLALSIPVSRPVVAMAIKTFVPIVLIVVCAALVFFVRPRYVEARIGLGITALLTLVALQITSGASLPDVDYLMMIDKIYLLAYLFIIVALVRIVATSWRASDEKSEVAISRTDRVWVAALVGLYAAANVAVAWSALAAEPAGSPPFRQVDRHRPLRRDIFAAPLSVMPWPGGCRTRRSSPCP